LIGVHWKFPHGSLKADVSENNKEWAFRNGFLRIFGRLCRGKSKQLGEIYLVSLSRASADARI